MHPEVKEILKDVPELVINAVSNPKDNLIPVWDRIPPKDYDKRIIDWYETLLELIDSQSNGGQLTTGPEVVIILQCTFDYRHNLAPTYDVYPAPIRPLGHFISRRSQKEKRWDIFKSFDVPSNKISILENDGSIKEIIIDHLRG